MADYFGAKQPSEKYYVQFDFSNDLDDEEIATVDVSAVDTADDSDATDTITVPADQSNTTTAVNVRVNGGTAGREYKISCKITGDGGSEYELDGILPVIEK